MNNPMLKFIMKGKKKDMVHTSVYAEAQNSGGIGAASTRSFADRMKIKGNRQRIREYNDSRVVTQAYASSGMKAKTYEAPEKNDAFLNKNEGGAATSVTKSTNETSSLSTTRTTNSTRLSQTSRLRNSNPSAGPSRPPVMRNSGISKKI